MCHIQCLVAWFMPVLIRCNSGSSSPNISGAADPGLSHSAEVEKKEGEKGRRNRYI